MSRIFVMDGVLEGCLQPRGQEIMALTLASKTNGCSHGLDALAWASTPVSHLLMLVLRDQQYRHFRRSQVITLLCSEWTSAMLCRS